MIRRIENEEISRVALMLSSAFSDYEQIQATFGGMESKEMVVINFFEIQMKALLSKGDIFVTNDLKAVCYGYDSKKISYIKFVIKLALGIMGMSFKLSATDKAIFHKNSKKTAGTENPFWHKKFIKGQYYHLLILGIDPFVQGKGILKELLLPIINNCNTAGIPIVLDTHSERNVNIYQHYGFKVEKTDVSNDKALTRYCMIHYPQ